MKKLISILIAVLMCFGAFGSVFAGTIKPHEVYSGTCGANVNWTLDTGTGVLSITGTGEMYDYNNTSVPWFSYRAYITSASIGSGVTSIGEFAFSRCNSLTSITIPDSVTSIGGRAFGACSLLRSITLPNSVTSIGDYAFFGCESMTSIIIPNMVTNIGFKVFEACTSLTSICIPDSVTSIGQYAFAGCSALTSIIIGNGVTVIEIGAFGSCTSLTSITIPKGVMSIGGYAFIGCSSLNSAVFKGEPPTDFGDDVFSDCASGFCIYYNPGYADLWSPNGETTWNGYPIVPYEVEAVPGDADGNGVIDTTDALYVLRCALGIDGDANAMMAVCDMDGSGTIDTTDALLILRMALGIE